MELDVKASPHLKAVAKLAAGPLSAAGIHRLRKPVDQEGFKYGRQIPSINTTHIGALKPGLLNHGVAGQDEIQDMPQFLRRATKVVGDPTAEHFVVLCVTSENK